MIWYDMIYTYNIIWYIYIYFWWLTFPWQQRDPGRPGGEKCDSAVRLSQCIRAFAVLGVLSCLVILNYRAGPYRASRFSLSKHHLRHFTVLQHLSLSLDIYIYIYVDKTIINIQKPSPKSPQMGGINYSQMAGLFLF